MKDVQIAGLNQQFLNELDAYRPLFSVQNGKALPVIADDIQSATAAQNAALFGVGLQGQALEGEPFFEVVERVAQIVNALLVADRIETAEELRNEVIAEEIKAELLKDLFDEYDGKIVRFENGHLVIDRSRLFHFVTEYLAQAQLATSA